MVPTTVLASRLVVGFAALRRKRELRERPAPTRMVIAAMTGVSLLDAVGAATRRPLRSGR